MRKRYLRRLTASFLGLFLFVTACVVQKNPVTGNKRAYGYSWEKEKQIGAQSDEQVRQQYGLYQNDDLQNYIDQIGQAVLEHSDMRDEGTDPKYKNTEFHYTVLDNAVVNAFALPGGYVYVDRGLLAYLENEAQLAMVLGHETGHVAARHASQQAFQQQVGQIALIGGAVAGQEILGIPGGDILNLGSQAAQLLFLKYSRDDEREADRLGVEYSAKSGYKASEGSGFFQALKRESQNSGQSVPEWQQTHPDPGERVTNIQKIAQSWKEKGYEQNDVNEDQYMHEIDNMIFGENPRHGFTRNGMFYHPDLKFKFPYPQQWQLINQAAAVQIVNSDQNAIITFQIDSKNNTPKASVNEFLTQDGITAGQGRATSYNGLNGYESTASGQTQDGNDVKFYLYSAEYNGNIYRFVSYTLAKQFNNYANYFKQTASGFDRLTDSGILNIQPARLHVYRADRTAKFSSFLPENLPLDIKAEEVAIANQVELNDTVQEGTWIKIPRQ